MASDLVRHTIQAQFSRLPPDVLSVALEASAYENNISLHFDRRYNIYEQETLAEIDVEIIKYWQMGDIANERKFRNMRHRLEIQISKDHAEARELRVAQQAAVMEMLAAEWVRI
jgi:hypothetical protein